MAAFESASRASVRIAQFFVEGVLLHFSPALGRELDEPFELRVDIPTFAAAAYRLEDAGDSLTVPGWLRDVAADFLVHFNPRTCQDLLA